MIVIFSEIDFDYIKQRHQIFAEFLSEEEEVVYVGRVGLRFPRFNEIISVFRSGNYSKPPKENEGIRICSGRNFVPPLNNIFRLINRVALHRFKMRSIKKEEVSLLIYYQPTSLVYDAIHKLKPVRVIYDCVQDYRFHPRKKVVIQFEKILLGLAQKVTADSEVNFTRLDHCNKKLVPPGVFIENYSRITRNPVKGKKFKLLYFGNIRNDLNFRIIHDIARLDFVELTLVGPYNSAEPRNKAITYIEPVPFEEIPDLLSSYHGILLPYLRNSFTEAIIPAKFFECIATRLPIIYSGLNIPDAYSNGCYLYEEISNSISLDLLNSLSGFKGSLPDDIGWSSRFKDFIS